MALYWKIRTIENPEHRFHVADRLKALRSELRQRVTDRTHESDLRLATWNLMHFGGGGGYERQTDAMLYIAEIIDHFDLVALQEVKSDLTQLQELLAHYLGPDWDYIVTDATGGDLGNDERMAFLYRKGKVRFANLAGEIVLEDGLTIPEDASIDHPEFFLRHKQFARTPFLVGFQCGWFQFKLCTVHMYFGNPKRPADMTDDAEWEFLRGDFMDMRKAEIRKISEFLSEKQKSERKAELAQLRAKGWDTDQSTANYILLGDFNIVSPEHETFEALTASGFSVPPGMEELHTNLGSEKRHYDQIAHMMGDSRVQHVASDAFNFRDVVFRREDAEHYIDVVNDAYMSGAATDRDTLRDRDGQISYFNRYRFKHQMSDHQLLWSAFKVDFADTYLDRIQTETGM